MIELFVFHRLHFSHHSLRFLSLSTMSTVVLFSQPQYQDPYIFNGKLIKGILAYIVPAQHRFTSALSTSVLNSSLSSAVSPTLEEFALPLSLSFS